MTVCRCGQEIAKPKRGPQPKTCPACKEADRRAAERQRGRTRRQSTKEAPEGAAFVYGLRYVKREAYRHCTDYDQLIGCFCYIGVTSDPQAMAERRCNAVVSEEAIGRLAENWARHLGLYVHVQLEVLQEHRNWSAAEAEKRRLIDDLEIDTINLGMNDTLRTVTFETDPDWQAKAGRFDLWALRDVIRWGLDGKWPRHSDAAVCPPGADASSWLAFWHARTMDMPEPVRARHKALVGRPVWTDEQRNLCSPEARERLRSVDLCELLDDAIKREGAHNWQECDNWTATEQFRARVCRIEGSNYQPATQSAPSPGVSISDLTFEQQEAHRLAQGQTREEFIAWAKEIGQPAKEY